MNRLTEFSSKQLQLQTDLPSDFKGELIPKEMQIEILSKLSYPEWKQMQAVSQSWYRMISALQIRFINEKKLSLDKILEGKDAEKVVEWLIKNPARELLEYANFGYIRNFDDSSLQQITLNCPNLKYLIIPYSKITSLEPLKQTPALQRLNVAECHQLKSDALKDLPAGLLILIIKGYRQVEADALKHLEKTPALQELNISGCFQFEPDALRHLEKTPALQSLNIVNCNQFERNALKDLPPSLKSLTKNGCRQLDVTAIPPNLTFLLENRV